MAQTPAVEGTAVSQARSINIKARRISPGFCIQCASFDSWYVKGVPNRAPNCPKSRAALVYREDFPERHGDPAWIVIRDGHDGMDLRADPVPLDRYPVKPHRYYMDNFAFPKTSAI